MSFFGSQKSKDSEPERPKARSSPPQNAPERSRTAPSARTDRPTHIAAGSTVKGRVTGDAELVIDGKVDGEVELESRVVVGEKGRVDGTITAVSVQLGGTVVGNIVGKEKVEVLTSGSLEGDVTAPRVMIADGAFFKGKVEMASAEPSAPVEKKMKAQKAQEDDKDENDSKPEKSYGSGGSYGEFSNKDSSAGSSSQQGSSSEKGSSSQKGVPSDGGGEKKAARQGGRS